MAVPARGPSQVSAGTGVPGSCTASPGPAAWDIPQSPARQNGGGAEGTHATATHGAQRSAQPGDKTSLSGTLNSPPDKGG